MPLFVISSVLCECLILQHLKKEWNFAAYLEKRNTSLLQLKTCLFIYRSCLLWIHFKATRKSYPNNVLHIWKFWTRNSCWNRGIWGSIWPLFEHFDQFQALFSRFEDFKAENKSQVIKFETAKSIKILGNV